MYSTRKNLRTISETAIKIVEIYYDKYQILCLL